MWKSLEISSIPAFQAVVCHEQIKWRKRSRKLVLFSTDSEFHYAGDGKLGGIVEPNDGLCHLDANGYEYEYSTVQVRNGSNC